MHLQMVSHLYHIFERYKINGNTSFISINDGGIDVNCFFLSKFSMMHLASVKSSTLHFGSSLDQLSFLLCKVGPVCIFILKTKSSPATFRSRLRTLLSKYQNTSTVHDSYTQWSLWVLSKKILLILQTSLPLYVKSSLLSGFSRGSFNSPNFLATTQ